MPYEFAALILVETNDPRLTETGLAEIAASAGGAARVRRAVLQHLPKDITRLVAVMPTDEAQQLIRLHEIVGAGLTGELFARPPSDYVPPTQE